MLGLQSRAVGRSWSELLCSIVRVQSTERHQRRPATRPHSTYRIPQFRRKIQPSNRVRYRPLISPTTIAIVEIDQYSYNCAIILCVLTRTLNRGI